MIKTKIFFLLMFISFGSFCQDSVSVTVYPTIITAWETSLPTSLKNNNPLIILDLPIVRKKLYTETRFNYDQINTLGIYAGRIFSVSKKSSHLFIPQLGLLYGDYKGAAFQFYYLMMGNKIDINFLNQYGISSNQLSDFYFNWSDIQYAVTNKIRLGTSIQIYHDDELQYLDLGGYIAYKTQKTSFALYSFNFWDQSSHFLILSIQRKIQFYKHKQIQNFNKF